MTPKEVVGLARSGSNLSCLIDNYTSAVNNSQEKVHK